MFKQINFATRLLLTLGLLAVTATSVFATPAHAQGACAQDYSVQADDWLSKLADKFLGDTLAYPTIVDATNAVAQVDASYASITNPDIIEIGWKLCLPDTAMMDGAMMEDSGEMMDDGAMMEDSGEMMDDAMAKKASFTVRIENITDGPILATAAGETVPVPFAPGVWAIHSTPAPLFVAGQPDQGLGLEALAEDGNPAGLAEALASAEGIAGSGVFNTPVDAPEAGPLLPGTAYEFTVEAAPGDYLSFATMFVQSNDLFYAPGGHGIDLFGEDGSPTSGDVTSFVSLWDAGTEINQEPGAGADQAPRQGGPNSGADENGVVQLVADGFAYPDTAQTILVTISSGEMMMDK